MCMYYYMYCFRYINYGYGYVEISFLFRFESITFADFGGTGYTQHKQSVWSFIGVSGGVIVKAVGL